MTILKYPHIRQVAGKFQGLVPASVIDGPKCHPEEKFYVGNFASQGEAFAAVKLFISALGGIVPGVEVYPALNNAQKAGVEKQVRDYIAQLRREPKVVVQEKKEPAKGVTK